MQVLFHYLVISPEHLVISTVASTASGAEKSYLLDSSTTLGMTTVLDSSTTLGMTTVLDSSTALGMTTVQLRYDSPAHASDFCRTRLCRAVIKYMS